MEERTRRSRTRLLTTHENSDKVAMKKSMETLLVILVGIVLALVVFTLYQTRLRPADTSMLLMQQQLDAMRQQISETISVNTTTLNQQLSLVTQQINQQLNAMVQQLQNATGQIGSRLDNAAKVVGEVKQNLGELSKATQQAFDV